MATKDYQPRVEYDITATIPASSSTSGAVDLHGTQLVGVFCPAEFDGTQLKIHVAPTLDGTYVPVQDNAGADAVLTAAASKYTPVTNLALTAGLRFIKLVSVTGQSTTDTVLTLATKPQ